MHSIITTLQAAARRSPIGIVIGVVVVTLLLGAASSLTVQEQGFENFAPDNEISATLERINEEFAAESASRAVQVSVYAPEGGDMLSAEGVQAAATIIEQVRADERLADVLVESEAQPGILTWADPVLGAVAQQGLPLEALTDDQVDELHVQALQAIPEAQRGFLGATLGGERTETSATAGLVIVFVEPDAVTETGDGIAQTALVDLRGEVNGFEVRPFDIAALAAEITDAITGQLGQLLIVAFGLIIVILVAIYRRPTDVVASLLGLVFTIVWMQGISALLGPRGLGWTGGQSEMSLAIPILLVGLGVDYGIHLTMRYREERAQDETPGEAAESAIGAVGVALLLATVTTVVGFLTNVTNPLPPLQDFGVFAAVGVVSAFIIMTTFVPSVRVLVDRRRARRGALPPERSQSTEPGLLGRAASALAPTAVRAPWAVLGVAAVLVLGGGLAATGLSTEFSQTEFFPTDSDALVEIERTQEAFQGDVTETTQVVVDGDLSTPAAYNALVEFVGNLADNDSVRQQVPVDSVVARLAAIQAAIAAQEGPGELPPGVDQQVVVDMFLTFQSSGFTAAGGVAADTDMVALYEGMLALDPSAGGVLSRGDGEGAFDAALVAVPTNVGDQVGGLAEELRDDAEPLVAAGLDVAFASDGLLIDLVLSELQSSQVRGLVLTLVASMVILALALWVRERKPILGVLAIVAVGAVVAWVFGIMALVGIPFNVMTAMVSALAIGIGVPFGIHVVNRFLEDFKDHDDLLAAMTSTLRNTGGALVGSAVTTMAGFGVLVFSTINPFRQFGVVLALTIGLALVSSIVVLPAMLAVWARRQPGPAGDRAAAPSPRPVASGAAALGE